MEDSLKDKKGLYSFVILLSLFGLMAMSLYLSFFFVKLTLPALFGILDADLFVNSPAEQFKNPPAMIYLQALSSSIGFFILPVLLFHFIFRYDMVSTMGLRKVPTAKYWLSAICIMFVAGIFTQLLVQINTAIPLSGKWQELRSMQAQVDQIIEAFFSDTSITRFLVLTLVMALLPAIGEELCFRGTIQNVLARTNLGNHGAIIVTGLTFSLIHFEFNNLLAIWCMGIVLGYLYFYSGSIWVNITAHFLNNFMVVVGKFAFLKGFIHSDIMSSDTLPIYVTLPAGAIMIAGLWLMRKWNAEKPEMPFIN